MMASTKVSNFVQSGSLLEMMPRARLIAVESAGHLPQSRQSGLHVETFAMAQLVSFDFVGNRWTRANDAHVATQHVE